MHKNLILMITAAQLAEGGEGEAREPFFTTIHSRSWEAMKSGEEPLSLMALTGAPHSNRKLTTAAEGKGVIWSSSSKA
ncbi:hypothetical protein E2C01_013039 [Portunus trituberculatus]|uniref:Uncharacterized protein n=1 Tax=Portunus trituberculatus TaxID=210409 RepID=A0A5B7DG14_PORTR|nr:hypothetical protein [Portunus trituberculatus]